MHANIFCLSQYKSNMTNISICNAPWKKSRRTPEVDSIYLYGRNYRILLPLWEGNFCIQFGEFSTSCFSVKYFFFYNHYILVTKSKLYTSLLKASSWLWLFQMITETGTWSKSVDFRILQSLNLVWLRLHPSYDGVVRNQPFCDKWAYCWIRIFVVARMGDSTIRLVG